MRIAVGRARNGVWSTGHRHLEEVENGATLLAIAIADQHARPDQNAIFSERSPTS
jgi:hypothetical protein